MRVSDIRRLSTPYPENVDVRAEAAAALDVAVPAWERLESEMLEDFAGQGHPPPLRVEQAFQSLPSQFQGELESPDGAVDRQRVVKRFGQGLLQAIERATQVFDRLPESRIAHR